jgi:hypothetical protein
MLGHLLQEIFSAPISHLHTHRKRKWTIAAVLPIGNIAKASLSDMMSLPYELYFRDSGVIPAGNAVMASLRREIEALSSLAHSTPEATGISRGLCKPQLHSGSCGLAVQWRFLQRRPTPFPFVTVTEQRAWSRAVPGQRCHAFPSWLRLRTLSERLECKWRESQAIHTHSLSSSMSRRAERMVTKVCERIIPTERPPLAGEVSANFCGKRVSRGQHDGSLRPYSRISTVLRATFVTCRRGFSVNPAASKQNPAAGLWEASLPGDWPPSLQARRRTLDQWRAAARQATTAGPSAFLMVVLLEGRPSVRPAGYYFNNFETRKEDAPGRYSGVSPPTFRRKALGQRAGQASKHSAVRSLETSANHRTTPLHIPNFHNLYRSAIITTVIRPGMRSEAKVARMGEKGNLAKNIDRKAWQGDHLGHLTMYGKSTSRGRFVSLRKKSIPKKLDVFLVHTILLSWTGA